MTRILICEPYKNLRALYAQELQAEGYEVELASDPNEAMQKLAAAKADLVVMDISPRTRHWGCELAAALRHRSGPPVILNAVYGQPFDDLLLVPADARLTKSSDLAELKQKISELLRRPRQTMQEEVCAA